MGGGLAVETLLVFGSKHLAGDAGCGIDHHATELAFQLREELLLLEGGRPIAAGPPAEVLTQQTVEAVFSWPVTMQTIDGRPQMVPLRKPKESRA